MTVNLIALTAENSSYVNTFNFANCGSERMLSGAWPGAGVGKACVKRNQSVKPSDKAEYYDITKAKPVGAQTLVFSAPTC